MRSSCLLLVSLTKLVSGLPVMHIETEALVVMYCVKR